MGFVDFFTDPVLRAPTIGCMLMALSSSLVGVFAFLRRRSLVGEALSHAAYPGVVLSIFFASDIGILIGAFITALLGLKAIDVLERKWKVKSDVALTLILSLFFGVGVLLASRLQVTHALWYRHVQTFLYGQAATMTDIHIVIYGILTIGVIGFILFLYRHLEALSFDRDFSVSLGIRHKSIDRALFFLLTLAIVIGIRSVGVVLMSGMLIAPAAAARQFSSRLSHLLIFAGVIGLFSGYMGNYLSTTIPNGQFSLPTGPMILLVASAICFLSLFFAPKNGLLIRYFRAAVFRTVCQMENSLKTFWRHGASGHLPSTWILSLLRLKKWVKKEHQTFLLTEEGEKRAEKIVRLHRLWEVYLVDYMGQKAEKLHSNAEELEHLITPELEIRLTELLQDPKLDPHQQPIPPKGGKT